jgi:Amidohydrolase family
MNIMKKALKILKKTIIGLLGLILIVLLFLALSIPYGKSQSNKPLKQSGEEYSKLVLTNVNIVSMDSNRVIYNQNIFLNQGKIVNITSDTIPINNEYKILEAKGKYILPGLIDMHAHIFDRTDLPQYLSYGVTTVRNMMGFPMHLRWKKQWESNQFPGSRLITASPTLNSGNDTGPFHKNIDTPDEARLAVEKYADAGYDFIKVYNGIDTLQLKAIEDAAKNKNVAIAGHPPSVSLERLMSSKLVSIEHIEELFYLLTDDYNKDKMRTIAKGLQASNKAVVINLAAFHRIYKTVIEGQTYFDGLKSKNLNPIIAYIGKKQLGDYVEVNTEYKDYCITKYSTMEEFAQILSQEGVTLLFGTDTGPALVIPGATVLEEIELLTKAGLSPFKILQSATYNAGKVLNRPDLGNISIGAQADLLILNENPLLQLQTLKNPKLVFAKDKVYDENALSQLRITGIKKQSTYVTLGLWLEHLFKK